MTARVAQPEAAPAADTAHGLPRLRAIRGAGGKDVPEPAAPKRRPLWCHREHALQELDAERAPHGRAVEKSNPRPAMAARLAQPEAAPAADTAHGMTRLRAIRGASGKDEPEPAAPKRRPLWCHREHALQELDAERAPHGRAVEKSNPRPAMAARLAPLEAAPAADTAHGVTRLNANGGAGGKDEPEPAAPKRGQLWWRREHALQELDADRAPRGWVAMENSNLRPGMAARLAQPVAAPATDTAHGMPRLRAIRGASGKDEPEPAGPKRGRLRRDREHALQELDADRAPRGRVAMENSNPRTGMAARLAQPEAAPAADTAHGMPRLNANGGAGGKDEPEPAGPLAGNSAQRRRMEARQGRAAYG
ncbi:hypothetical protein SH611_10375 [Geminicoccaceae bacterium 1502E]|nr:hypothetical protein [Geminicoccaceae bacterium 1502E]